MSQLARLCEHGNLGPHPAWRGEFSDYYSCPGGNLLSPDALVVEKVDGRWPHWATALRLRLGTTAHLLDALLAASGEPIEKMKRLVDAEPFDTSEVTEDLQRAANEWTHDIAADFPGVSPLDVLRAILEAFLARQELEAK